MLYISVLFCSTEWMIEELECSTKSFTNWELVTSSSDSNSFVSCSPVSYLSFKTGFNLSGKYIINISPLISWQPLSTGFGFPSLVVFGQSLKCCEFSPLLLKCIKHPLHAKDAKTGNPKVPMTLGNVSRSLSFFLVSTISGSYGIILVWG